MNSVHRHINLVIRAGIGLAVAASALFITFQFSSANSDPTLSNLFRRVKADRLAELLPKAEEQGQLRIIVELNVPYQRERILAGGLQAQNQRSAIASAQSKLDDLLVSPQSAIVRNFESLPLSVLNVDASDFAALADSPLVKRLQEDVPDLPLLDGSIPLIGADNAWSSGYTGAGQSVAILDTGVDNAHEFLAGKVVAEACFSTIDAGSTSSTLCPGGGESEIGAGAAVNCSPSITGCDHGTHVAGIAAGTGPSFSGVAKGADIIAVQVFSRFDSTAMCGAGNTPCILSWTSDQIAGLDWVYSQSITYAIAAANMSLGSGTFNSNCDTDFRKAYIDQLRSVGIATVIASGNNASTSAISKPACISTAISVGSTTSSDIISSFSNIASFISLLAPGSSINSSIPGDLFGSMSGTSMAAPHVTGAWAVLKSKDPEASVDGVLAALVSTGVSIDDTRGGGSATGISRIQVDSAVAALPTPTGSDVYITPDDGEVTINLGDNVIYGFEWTACSKGLSNDVLRSSQVIVALRRSGTTVQRFGGPASRLFWSSPSIVPGSDTSVCFWPAADLWEVLWENDQLVLDEAGVYRIVLIWRLREPIIDGYFDSGGTIWYDSGDLLISTVQVNVVP